MEGDSMEHIKIQLSVPQRTDPNTKKTYYEWRTLSFTMVLTDDQKKNIKSLSSVTIGGNFIGLQPKDGTTSNFNVQGDATKQSKVNSIQQSIQVGKTYTGTLAEGPFASVLKTDGTTQRLIIDPLTVTSYPAQY